MKLVGALIMVVFMLLGFGIGGSLIYSSLTLEVGDKQVKCFDRFSNEIIGQTCIRETTQDESIGLFTLGVVIIIGFVAIGFSMGNMMSYNPYQI